MSELWALIEALKCQGNINQRLNGSGPEEVDNNGNVWRGADPLRHDTIIEKQEIQRR